MQGGPTDYADHVCIWFHLRPLTSGVEFLKGEI